MELWAQINPWCLWWAKEDSRVSSGVIGKRNMNREGRWITKGKVEERVVLGTLWSSRSGLCLFCFSYFDTFLWILSGGQLVHLILWTFGSCVLSMSNVFLPLHFPPVEIYPFSRLTPNMWTKCCCVGDPSQFTQLLSQISISILFFQMRNLRLKEVMWLAQRHSSGGRKWSPPAIALSTLYCTSILLVLHSLVKYPIVALTLWQS